MVLEYIRYTIPVEQRAEFESAYTKAQTSLARSPHCLGWELAQCIEEAGNYILRIEWDSVDGHVEGFRKSPEFTAFIAAVRPFLDRIAEMRHYALTAIAGGGRG